MDTSGTRPPSLPVLGYRCGSRCQHFCRHLHKASVSTHTSFFTRRGAAPYRQRWAAASREGKLFFACQEGQVDAARLLLDNGAAVDRATEDGRTPLYVACENGHVDAVRLLLDQGADVDRATNNGSTPLYAACNEGHVDAARLLLDNGAAVDRAQKQGATPLFITCVVGHIDLARLLLEKGAEVDRATNTARGRTPLDIAKEEGHSAVVALLEQHRKPAAVVEGVVVGEPEAMEREYPG